MLYLTVPAYQLLWSHEDEDGGHFRRYTLRSLIGKLEQTGFSVEFSSYIFTFLTLIIFLFRTLPYRFKLLKKANNTADLEKDHSTPKGFREKVLNFIMHLEVMAIRKKKRFFHGGSCLITATKTTK
jgi:hypothetical protein